jgi:threonine dehydratase
VVVGTRLDGGRVGAARGVIDPVFLDTPMYPCDALGRALG